jgi:hypothetical protein
VVFTLDFFDIAIAKDMMAAVNSLFCLAGLSLVHFLARTMNRGWIWLTILYASAIFLVRVEIIILSFIALLDVWMDFRKRFEQKPV